ncbi:MAG: LURP-one-related family protein [Firmicutes bacterium]|nr:LURP-one-related family protein [Bacillota bacterium]
MKLILKEKILSILDSFNVYDENDDIYFKVKGKVALAHKTAIYDAKGREVGMVKEKIIDILPTFSLYKDGEKVGECKKKISVIKPKFEIDFNGWDIKGDWLEWDYSIVDKNGKPVAVISKKLLRLTDTYVIDVKKEEDALDALMVVLAIDAEKCRRETNENKKEASKLKKEAARVKAGKK